MPLVFRVNGRDVEVADDGASLLEVLRDRLGIRSPKDGCSPQGQCGCCTVLVDGAARVACVTPARRVAGRQITTLEGLGAEDRRAWAEAFCSTGASQCGFCTPGIIMRLSALASPSAAGVDQALLAHLCRCTGWNTIAEAVAALGKVAPVRDLDAAGRRATLEGGAAQRVGIDVALGAGGFADDHAPLDALVAVPDATGGWAVGETLTEARTRAGKVQGRRSGGRLHHPLAVAPGAWDLTLRTTWVEPGYLELDASWCRPGGEPATPLANGGAFGGKLCSPVAAVARRLADEHGRAVRVVLAREDAVRLGPKRPPMSVGIRGDGTGVMRVARTVGIAEAVAAVAPGLVVDEVDIAGPPTSLTVRGAGWVEAAVVVAAVRDSAVVRAPNGAEAEARVEADGSVHVRVRCGDALDPVVLRSYCIGAVHMALGWVRSEGIAVDDDGVPQDLTVRSFGILRARDMPPVHVDIDPAAGPPVGGSDAVFAAVAAAAWKADGHPPTWPTRRPSGKLGAKLVARATNLSTRTEEMPP